jgi:hypothetical protein
MLKTPQFRYFLSDDHHPVNKDDSIWRSNPPTGRRHPQATGSEKSDITYGEYFEAVSHFLDKSADWKTNVAASIFTHGIRPWELTAYSIYLEKHGAFYHPGRVVVPIRGRTLSMVVNVAISEVGKTYLNQEVENLIRLQHMFSYDFLPKVYGSGQVVIDEKRTVSMFIGEWFEDYAEFHVSQKKDGQAACIMVWDPAAGPYALSENLAAAVYEQAAEILTACYAIETCEQIFSWHHAAGDFVVKHDPGGVKVKLVTVRRYGRIFESHETGPEAMVPALLLFLLNMSIRMRLDRLDGVGELTWLDDYAVDGAVRGFFKGLERKEKNGILPSEIADAIKQYLQQIPKADILGLFKAMVDRLPPETPDLPTIKAHINAHVESFLRSLRRI